MPHGNWREVHLIGDVAVKVPRSDRSPVMQREAMLLNRWEHEMWAVWRPKFQWPHLCPVLRCDPMGDELVMRRAVMDVTVEEIAAMLARYYPDITSEPKVDSWGRLDGLIVAVDYGPDGWTEADVQQHRDYYAAKAGPAIDTR